MFNDTGFRKFLIKLKHRKKKMIKILVRKMGYVGLDQGRSSAD
jgi:hypothetical protein